MTTTQAAPNGQRVSPPPSSVENPAELNSANLPADQDHSKHFAASAYHVPPSIYVPKAHAYRNDCINRPHLDGPLPHRCQFMFSDGRQCTMARSDIHPSLCVYHSEREEQLFGDPFAESLIRGRVYDLPELFSAARDLSTAASLNRALAQVFRLLAQRRISRQEAATFAHLAKLLLRTISLMSSCESSAANVYLQDELRGVDKVNQELSHVNKVESAIRPESSSRPPAKVTNGMSFRRSTESNWSEGPLPESAPSCPDEVEPPPGGYVMRSEPRRDTSSMCCRPETPVLEEQRFQLSGCTRGEPLTAESHGYVQFPQNQHLQNCGTSTPSK